MSETDQLRRLVPYAQELVENEYAQRNLRDGLDKLREASRRLQKRRVEPTRDERLRRQLISAAQSLTEAGQALRSGRRKPQRRWKTRLMVIGGLTAAGAVTAIWAKERLDAPSAPDPASEEAAPA